DKSGKRVLIQTEGAIQVSALALILRVQCPGAKSYARHFRVLIPPPVAQVPDRIPASAGLRLRLRPGDTVESVAEALFPAQRSLRQAMVAEVINANPTVFTDGRIHGVPPGTVLWFPDPRDLRKLTQPRLGPNAPSPRPAQTKIAGESISSVTAPAPAQPRRRIGERPMLQRRTTEPVRNAVPPDCASIPDGNANAATVAPESRTLETRTRDVESVLGKMRQSQAAFDSQLSSLEHALQGLQKTVAAASTCVARPVIEPVARQEIHTAMKGETKPWYFWLGSALLALITGASGFLFARRRLLHDLEPKDEQANQRARPIKTGIELTIHSTLRPQVPGTAGRVEQPPLISSAQAIKSSPTPRRQVESQSAPSAPRPDSIPASASSPLPTTFTGTLAHEMDEVLNNTRSIFNDVDRFIAMGRTKNALGLLELELQQKPDDRDVWIKLMAVYRQEKMSAELESTAREFSQHFPSQR
ncbi:unnamed protein product, partial [Phaeothamnion confervicola]